MIISRPNKNSKKVSYEGKDKNIYALALFLDTDAAFLRNLKNRAIPVEEDLFYLNFTTIYSHSLGCNYKCTKSGYGDIDINRKTLIDLTLSYLEVIDKNEWLEIIITFDKESFELKVS